MTYEDPNQQQQQQQQQEDSYNGYDRYGRGSGPDGKKLRIASNSKYPSISVIPDQDTMDRAKTLLTESQSLSVRRSEIDERLEEIRIDLAAVCMTYDLPGFRFGLAAFEYHGYKSKSGLDKGLLAERLAGYGVPASVIGECYVSGEEYLSCRLQVFDLP